MQDQQKQLVERLKQAQNILVTVSKNPSVDQLSAAIGLTLVLNHLDKHATAVFSGQVPSTLEFLKPEETLEKNTDSLRDFIIALDKSKADKLRYKVEDDVVRIFITPYKTSISEKDLEFSQGDFNVDVVVALGVTDQLDLDEAITSHGRILHDATVASINLGAENGLGSIVWSDHEASSLSELVENLTEALDKKIIDSQISTALLTGIVSATERFRNDKTSPKTMSVSATLMAAGANQQLIATELETVAPEPEQPETPDEQPEGEGDGQAEQNGSEEPEAEAPKPEPGTLEIDHQSDEHEEHEHSDHADHSEGQSDDETDQPDDEQPEQAKEEPEHETYVPPPAEPEVEEPQHPQVHVDENGHLSIPADEPLPEISKVRGVPLEEHDSAPSDEHQSDAGAFDQPEHSSEPAVNNFAEDADSAAEDLTLPSLDMPVLSHDAPAFAAPTLPPLPEPEAGIITPSALPEVTAQSPELAQSQPAPWSDAQSDDAPAAQASPSVDTGSSIPAITPDETLTDIEKAVDSPHLEAEAADAAPQDVDSIRSTIEAAYQNGADPSKPPLDLNALPLGNELHDTAPEATPADFTAQPTSQQPAPFNAGFSEPTPGNSPADQTLDMPLPQNAFGTATSAGNPFMPAPQSTTFQTPGAMPTGFPSAPTQNAGNTNNDNSGTPPPPPVPPPMLPPLQ